jgi:tRNA dimethylallyltransferase
VADDNSNRKAQPVLILFGPTASGKTALLEALFTGASPVCRAEVISADSMQVYRGMDIGTAKPDKTLTEKLPHHLIDIKNPNEPFNAGDFVRLADKACAGIAGRGALPVLSGGTGFYLKNFIYGLPSAPPSDSAIREALKAELAQKGTETLKMELARLDPASAERIHINDTYRLLRALEVCRASNQPLSAFAVETTAPRPEYRFLTAKIALPREALYGRITARCEEMFSRGLADEAAGLFRQGYTPDDPGLRAIGYREFFVENPSLAENSPLETGQGANRWSLSHDIEGVKALVIRNCRRYAKRQETFFSGMEAVDLPGQNTDKALDLLSSLIHTI